MYGIPDRLKALSAAEEQVLLALWDCKPPVSRRDIGARLAEKGWAAATVLNFLYRLEEKGWVTCTKEQNHNLYAPTVTRRAYGVYTMRQRLDTVFGGDLAQAVRALGGFDLILCGRQAIDGDTAQVGPMLAEHLGLPQLTCACAITIEDGAIRIRQEGERAYRVLRAPLPAVVTVVKTINEPRLPNVMRKLQANRMQPQTLTADDLPALDPDCIGLHGSPTKVSRTFVPVRTKQTVRIDGAQPEAAVASLLAQLDAAHISLEGGGDHV